MNVTHRNSTSFNIHRLRPCSFNESCEVFRLSQLYHRVKAFHFNQGREEYFAAVDSKRHFFFFFFPPLLETHRLVTSRRRV